MTSVDRQGDGRVFEWVQTKGEDHTGSPPEAPWCFHPHRHTRSAAYLGDTGPEEMKNHLNSKCSC